MSDRTSAAASNGVRAHGFANITQYIEDITYAIWNEPRDPDLVRRFYGPETPIYTDSADLVGSDAVTANTKNRLVAFPDFHGVIDDTIWTGSEEDGYRTSMRWTWTATNTGPSVFGAARGRPVRFSAIANCVVRGELIVEEWLSSNPLLLARQLGLDADEGLRRWSEANPRPGSGARPSGPVALAGPCQTVADVWDAALNGDDPTAVRQKYDGAAVHRRGATGHVGGREDVEHWMQAWRRLCPDLSWEVDDAYWSAADEALPARAALQWTLRGHHHDRPVRVAGISHHHVRDGRVVAEWIEYDELALLRQCGRLP